MDGVSLMAESGESRIAALRMSHAGDAMIDRRRTL
jgi:hypothetical protein